MGKNKPLFSIVIPTFNRAAYLGRALQSVFNQTYSNWEVIIVDNYSTDDTDKLLKEFYDSRVRVFNINNHGSISVSRNLGINESNGEWIVFLDSDDWWDENKLEECFKYLNSNVDLYYHDLQIVEETEIVGMIKSRKLKKPILVDLLKRGNTIATSSVIVRKSILKEIGGMNESSKMINSSDYNTWLRIARISERFCYIPKSLGYYQKHADNLSGKSIYLPTIECVNEFLYLLSIHDQFKVKSNIAYIEARLRFNLKEYEQAKEYFYLIKIKYSPATFLKSKIMLLFIKTKQKGMY